MSMFGFDQAGHQPLGLVGFFAVAVRDALHGRLNVH